MFQIHERSEDSPKFQTWRKKIKGFSVDGKELQAFLKHILMLSNELKSDGSIPNRWKCVWAQMLINKWKCYAKNLFWSQLSFICVEFHISHEFLLCFLPGISYRVKCCILCPVLPRLIRLCLGNLGTVSRTPLPIPMLSNPSNIGICPVVILQFCFFSAQ